MATLKGIEGTYKTHRHYGSWRVTFYAKDQEIPGTLGYLFTEHIADFNNYEDAIRKTYQLNGWKEPKQIQRRF